MNMIKTFFLVIGTNLALGSQNSLIAVDATPAGRDPFLYSWKQQVNPHVKRGESDSLVMQRIGSAEVLQFLSWWEQKYQLTELQKENIYTGHAADLDVEERYWSSLGTAGQNHMKHAWFRENSATLLPEYRLFVLARIFQTDTLENQQHDDHGEKYTDSQSEFEGHVTPQGRRRSNASRR